MPRQSTVGTTLNLDGLQPGDRILVSYEDGPDCWMHERLCLAQVGPRLWVMATPHFDVYEEDLDEYSALYPVGKLGGVDASLLDRSRVMFKRDELRMQIGALLADGEDYARAGRAANFVPNAPTGDPKGTRGSATNITSLRPFTSSLGVPEAHSIWVALEAAGGYRVGDVVRHDPNMPCLGDRGLLLLRGGGGVGIQSMAVGRVGTVDIPAGPATVVDDMRTMEVKYRPGQSDQRGRNFADGVASALEHPFPDWPVPGPRTCRWLLAAFVSSDTTPLRRHYWWRSTLGLDASDDGVDDHLFLSELLELSMSFDQLNSPDLAVFEHISRRYQTLEETYADALRDKSNGARTGRGLDSDERALYLGTGASTTMALVAPDLQAYVATKVGERSAILRERRKGREERLAAAAVTPTPPNGRDKKGGKAKGKE
jgi:hypothetical protein